MSVSVTDRMVMFEQGMSAVHLNCATVVCAPRMLLWLLLPLTRSNEMLAKSVVVLPSGVLHGNGQ